MSGVQMESVFQTLQVSEIGRVASVSLNRPELRNSFHPVMIRELTRVFTQLSARQDISAVVLKGEGKSFCSGADLGYMKSMASFSLDENQKDSRELFAMFASLRSCPHPVIGRIHGHAIGGGLGLIAVCDFAAAVTDTQFCFSEVKLGLAPAVISPFVLERMSSAFARRYMLTGETFGTAEALASGLIQFSGNGAQVDQFVKSVTEALAQNGPEAVRATKNLLQTVTKTNDWEQVRDFTTKLISERRVSAEGQEGLRGFLEKRAPGWRPAK